MNISVTVVEGGGFGACAPFSDKRQEPVVWSAKANCLRHLLIRIHR